MAHKEQIDIYNEVDNFVEENVGEVSHTEIARHFYEVGRNNAIEEACEWLDENMNDVGIRFMRGDEIKDIVDLFRKAMKGGRG